MDVSVGSNITVRRFRPSDRELVNDFYASMGEVSTSFFNVNHGNEKRTLGWFDGERNDHIFWAATTEYDGKEIMVGLIFIWDIDKKIPWLGVAVRDGWQGRHIGRRLIAEVRKFTEEKGCGGILLDTATDNHRAQALYEHCGFERIGVHTSGEYLYLLRFDNGAKD